MLCWTLRIFTSLFSFYFLLLKLLLELEFFLGFKGNRRFEADKWKLLECDD